jgi:hypothetical protein
MTTDITTVRVTPVDSPAGKLADAEVIFGADAGPLRGLKLIGFGIWERRGRGARNVTFPARQFSVNGERRSFVLLRPVRDLGAQEPLKALILDAYSRLESAGPGDEADRETPDEVSTV